MKTCPACYKSQDDDVVTCDCGRDFPWNAQPVNRTPGRQASPSTPVVPAVPKRCFRYRCNVFTMGNFLMMLLWSILSAVSLGLLAPAAILWFVETVAEAIEVTET